MLWEKQEPESYPPLPRCSHGEGEGKHLCEKLAINYQQIFVIGNYIDESTLYSVEAPGKA